VSGSVRTTVGFTADGSIRDWPDAAQLRDRTIRFPSANWNSTPDDPVYHASMLRGSRAVAGIACLLLVSVSRAFGAAPDTVFLEELTWTEVRDLIRSGRTTIIVPTGGAEPHRALLAPGDDELR